MGFVKYDQDGFVGVITINRPEALNALNTEVIQDLDAVLDSIDLGTTRVLVVTGAGEKSFVAGADIAAMSTMTVQEAREFSKAGNDVFRKLETLPIPSIAAVNGFALGGGNELAKTTLFKILAGEMEPDEGSYKWGVTTSQSYFPKDNTAIFDSDELIVDWLTQYSEIKDATYVRGFLGRMLFAGEDGVKKMRVLSGGEKVRVLLSRMMIMGSNVLIFDEPTDHLDMESITALNNGMIKFPGVILFACRDHQVVQTTANRIIEFLPDGSMVDKVSTYDEYLESDVMARKRQVYNTTADEEADD